MTKPELKRLLHGEYIYVGRYEMYGEHVGLFGQTGTSRGHFNFDVDDDKRVHPKDDGKLMIVGLDADWATVLGTFLHEAAEWAAARLRCRMTITDQINSTSASFHFIMDHEVFTEMCDRAGDFMADALPDLCEIHRAYTRYLKKKK